MFYSFAMERSWALFITFIPDYVLGDSGVKNPPANAGYSGFIPGSGRYSEEGNGNPLQYPCLGNPIYRGAWWTIVLRVAKI